MLLCCVSCPDHIQNEETYAQALDKFGSNFISRDNVDLGTAFVKFSTLTKELSALLKNLVSSPKSVFIFHAPENDAEDVCLKCNVLSC